MKKYLLMLAICCSFAISLYAQRATDEQPYGLKDGFRALPQDVIALSAPDLAQIEKEDKENYQKQLLRYAYPVWVNYTSENSGVWQQLDDGSMLWRLKVNIPGALATTTYYDKFWLPEGGKFFVYSEDTRQTIGAVTSEFIDGSREKPIEFATALIYGENVVYEYYQPISVKEIPIISINRIDYGYRYVNNPLSSENRNLGSSGSCHVNINCSEGNIWQTEKNAVTRISFPLISGTYWMSGSLVNNTNNDYTPYVLTCSWIFLSTGFDAVTNPDASQWIFYWHYERPDCTNNFAPTERTSTGATIVANDNDFLTFFALLKIAPTQDPRFLPGVTPYYLGWDRSGLSGTGGVGIHHPKGDVKKISTYSQVPQSYDYYSINTHWALRWIQTTNGYSVADEGSWGSPLINSNRRIIGQHHASGTTNGIHLYDLCTNPASVLSTYGKFSISWTGSNTNTPHSDHRRRLNHWLAPGLSNPPLTLNGLEAPSPEILGPDEVCTTPVTFTLHGGYHAITWMVFPSNDFTINPINSTTATVSANSVHSLSGAIVVITEVSPGEVISVSKEIIACGTPEIEGSSTVCPSGTFYISNGQNANWSVSSGFSVSSTFGSSTVVTATEFAAQGGTLTAVINGETIHKSIQLCPPTLNGPSSLCGIETYTLSPSGYEAIEWIINPYFALVEVSSNPTSVTVNAFGPYSWQIGSVVAIIDGYGGVPRTVYVSCRGGFGGIATVYPNPVSDILIVEIDNSNGGGISGVAINYDVRLYDGQGNMLRQQFTHGGRLEFNVSGLPEGVYYLHVYDSVSPTPEIHQVVVER